MIKTTGQANVTIENKLIPIAGDGDCAPEPISECTVEAALNNFEWTKGYLGFKFAQVATATVVLDSSSEEIAFTSKKNGPTTYRFADKLISNDELANNPAYKEAFTHASKYYPNDLRDNALLHYERNGRVGALEKHNLKDTVLINKAGEQLWPALKA